MAARVGDIVLYRSRAGVDMPALVTALTDDPQCVHLHAFPPPGRQADILSFQWGTPLADDGEPAAQTWRPRERERAK